VKKLLFLLFIGVLIRPGSRAAAQDFLEPSAGGPIAGPPQLALPALGSGTRGSATRESLPVMELPATSSSMPGMPIRDALPEPISAIDLQPELQPFVSGHEYQMDCEPALLESTGTWLRRGFWYTEVDALLMDRIWARDDSILAFQPGTANTLFLEGGRQGSEATPRLKLGRFLFRDQQNRDHAAEFIAYGGGQWTKSGRLDAANGGTLTSVIGGGNPSFTGATSTLYDYDSRFNSFELNYHRKSRMKKDRMELEPNGEWVRRAQPSFSRSVMAGIRYFDLNEDFDWNAFGIDDDGLATTDPQTGNYRVRTDNDLIGTQVGFGWTYETARWSLGLNSKSGMYLNHTDVDSSFVVTGGVTSGESHITVDNLSFVTEAAVVGKWHMRPNFSLRAGMEILFVSSVAHASEQLDFVPVSTSHVVAGGNSTYMGGLIGFEGYW